MSQFATAPHRPSVRAASRKARTAPAETPIREPSFVRRTALVNRLRAARTYGVATIVAPAGYGKTTLLEQWASRDDRRFVWITHRALAADRPGLAAQLTAAASPLVLVVDDVHRVGARGLETLSALARLTGDGSMLVLAGHSEPRLPTLSVSVLRARGELLELGARDLAFGAREVRRLLAGAPGPTTEREVATLIEETEGWPEAVQLAAAARGVGRLQAECLTALSPGRRAFLRQTSVLDRLTPPLCDAVLGRAGAADDLLAPELSAFFVPLDHSRLWFRCHRLLRDRLRRQLEAEEPDLVPVLHRRAADWFEAHGAPEQAMAHADAAGDAARFMRIFASAGLPTHEAGHAVVVDAWLRRVCDADDLQSHPEAAILAARLHAHNGRARDTARCLAAAAAAAGETRAPVAARVSLVRAATDPPSPEKMLAAAESALEALPADDPWRPYGLLLQGVAHVLLGDGERAGPVLGRCATAAGRLGAIEIQALALTESALAAEAAGEHQAADAYLERVHALGDRLDSFPSYALALAAGARGHLRRGRWADARHSLASARHLVVGLTEALPWLAVQTRLELAAGFVMLRDSSAARLPLEKAEEIMVAYPSLGVLRQRRDGLAAEIEAMPVVAEGRRVRLTDAELRLLPLLATHLSFREIGDHFFLSRHTVKTQAISAYRKLGASSRSGAVERAEQLGLIETTADGSHRLIPSG